MAARVQADTLETLEEKCLVSDDPLDEEDCKVDRSANTAVFVLAGTRAWLAFEPVAVVQEVIMCLRRQYGVKVTYGVPGVYRGRGSPVA